MTMTNWLCSFPDDFFVTLLTSQLQWQEIARLDSALCVSSDRSMFLRNISKVTCFRRSFGKKNNVIEYLNWVSLRKVRTCWYLYFEDLSTPVDTSTWKILFPFVYQIYAPYVNKYNIEMVNALWLRCPNVRHVKYPTHYTVQPYVPDAPPVDTTLLPLFKSCQKITHLEAIIYSLSAEEAELVPRGLKVLELCKEHSDESHFAVELAQMVGHLHHLANWSMPPALYTNLAQSCKTLTEVVLYKCDGVAGAEAMLRTCVHLSHLHMMFCHDLSSESFALMFQLPALKTLKLGHNTTILGLPHSYHSTTIIEELKLSFFAELLNHPDETCRILLACPLLKTGNLYGTVNWQFKAENPDLCANVTC